MVPQDAFLFSTTLAENIAFGRPDADRAPRSSAAAERAQLAKDVEDLPDGYDTIVGERGVMLSGGQRQRTALARALLLDPAILILDDTLSAVDAETEAAIQRELDAGVPRGAPWSWCRRASPRCATPTRSSCSTTGRIVERGTPRRAASRRGGLYARLAEEQARSDDRERELAGGGALGVSAPRPPGAPRASALRRGGARQGLRRAAARGGSGATSRRTAARCCVTVLLLFPLLALRARARLDHQDRARSRDRAARDRRAAGRGGPPRRVAPAAWPLARGALARAPAGSRRPRDPAARWLAGSTSRDGALGLVAYIDRS